MNNEQKQRKQILERAVKDGKVFCDKHEYLLRQEDLNIRHCYDGNRGRGYCQYLSWLFKLK